MKMGLLDFIEYTGLRALKQVEQAKLLCYYFLRKEERAAFTAKDISSTFCEAGFGTVNESRLIASLASRGYILKCDGQNGYRFTEAARTELDREYDHLWSEVLGDPSTNENVLLNPAIFKSSTYYHYFETLVAQANRTYLEECFDATALILRRIISDAIVLALRSNGKEQLVLDSGGGYLGLSRLLDLAGRELPIDRNIKLALEKVRKCGNSSAHAIGYNAKQDDIDRLFPDCRVAMEQIIKMAM